MKAGKNIKYTSYHNIIYRYINFHFDLLTNQTFFFNGKTIQSKQLKIYFQ
jgi:hypothetical protein